MKIIRTKKFGKFMEFFLKGLNHFKIQTKFNLVWILKFQLTLYWEFELLTKSKVVPFELIYHHAKFRNFWSPQITIFIFYNFESI
jgi:hypothetical protein